MKEYFIDNYANDFAKKQFTQEQTAKRVEFEKSQKLANINQLATSVSFLCAKNDHANALLLMNRLKIEIEKLGNNQ
jgi:hypothetical protein